MLLTICTLTLPVPAKDIAPKDPPVVAPMSQVIDRTTPQYVPRFLQPGGQSVLQQERDWSILNNVPPRSPWGLLGVRHGWYQWGPTHSFSR
ncbi:MAG: hypothetical protein H7144_04530 [Burkholderiales bacterium]|nr:hypothetical protein [Phycisphaerae bacterium]